MSPWRTEIRAQLALALPCVVVNLGMMAMGVVDILMVGHYSTPDLASISLGHGYSFLLLCFGMGVMMALDPLVSQAVGAGDRSTIATSLQRALVLGAVLSLPIALLMLPAGPVFTLMRQQPEVIPLATRYVYAVIPGVPAFLFFVAFRQTLQATGRLRPIVITILVANIANVLLNQWLIFGGLGVPALGSAGSGLATSIVRWLMSLALVGAAWPELGSLLRPFDRAALALAPLLSWLRLGAPIGLTLMIELAAFHALTVLMGILGTIQMAGHQAVMSIASTTFMVPLGISMAATVRVGYGVGRGDMPAARLSARVSLLGGVLFMALMAAALFLFPEALAGSFTDDTTVIAIAVLLMPLAAAFQVFDGTQVVASGILRGIGDTRMPALYNLLGYWAIGLPFGWWLTFEQGVRPRGPWWGMVAGLIVVALLLLGRVIRRLARDVERVDLADEPSPGPETVA